MLYLPLKSFEICQDIIMLFHSKETAFGWVNITSVCWSCLNATETQIAALAVSDSFGCYLIWDY